MDNNSTWYTCFPPIMTSVSSTPQHHSNDFGPDGSLDPSPCLRTTSICLRTLFCAPLLFFFSLLDIYFLICSRGRRSNWRATNPNETRARTYGSISGWMNIHSPPILMFTRGTGFDPQPNQAKGAFYDPRLFQRLDRRLLGSREVQLCSMDRPHESGETGGTRCHLGMGQT